MPSWDCSGAVAVAAAVVECESKEGFDVVKSIDVRPAGMLKISKARYTNRYCRRRIIYYFPDRVCGRLLVPHFLE
jgi:hypothetical protein